MTSPDLRALARPATYPARRVELAQGFDASDYERPRRAMHSAVPEEVAWRLRGLQRLVEAAPVADWVVDCLIPSAANLREHHHAKAARVRRARALAYHSVPGVLRGYFAREGAEGLVVLLVRLAPRPLDSDNLASALKAHRDGLADAMGVDDRSPRVQWELSQQRARQPGLRVYVVTRGGHGDV